MIVAQLGAIVLAAVLVALGVRVTVRWRSQTPPARPHRPVAARFPADLERDQDLIRAAGNAGSLHSQLRPVLREIAGARLALRGVALDGHDGRAPALLGDELWELVRPGRPRPTDNSGPGISAAELGTLFDRLEAL